MSQRLLIVGAGHAHLGVLAALARRPLPDTSVTVVTPYPRQIYSGMLPGWLAGRYTIDELSIPVEPVVRRAGAELLQARVTGLNLERRLAYTDAGYSIDFDFVSLDIGASQELGGIRGAAAGALAIRPLEDFLLRWRDLRDWLAQATQPVTLTIVGGGAAGVEIALAVAAGAAGAARPGGWAGGAGDGAAAAGVAAGVAGVARVAGPAAASGPAAVTDEANAFGTSEGAGWQPLLRVQLVAGRDGVAPTLPASARDRLLRALARGGIRVIEDQAEEIGEGTMLLADGGELTTDAVVIAIGAGAPAWPAKAGLAVDRRGFVVVNRHLQSTSHPFVFAAGDCATLIEHPRPKSGVYAVRAGLPLAENLRRHAQQRPLRSFVPQARALSLMATGRPYAIGCWGGFSFEGRWAWRWKEWLDLRFVRGFQRGG